MTTMDYSKNNTTYCYRHWTRKTTKNDMLAIQEWKDIRARAIAMYEYHPIIIFLRNLPEKIRDDIIFYFSEISVSSENENQYRWALGYLEHLEPFTIEYIAAAFRIVCPKVVFSVKTVKHCKYTDVSFNVSWKTGEMHQIITDKTIFPMTAPIGVGKITI